MLNSILHKLYCYKEWYLKAPVKWVLLCKNWYSLIYLHLFSKKGELFLKLRNGLILKIHVDGLNSDTVIVSDIYFNKPYTREGYDILDNDIVIDIGANIGVFSTFAAKAAKNVKVYSFEALKENFNYLKYNTDTNNLKSSIKYFNLAVTSKKGKCSFFVNPCNSGSHSIYSDLSTIKAKKITVNTIGLKDILTVNHINKVNLLKLDCEGAEYDILFSAPKKLLKKIDKISMEIHEIKKFSVKEMEIFLIQNGFIIEASGHIIRARRIM